MSRCLLSSRKVFVKIMQVLRTCGVIQFGWVLGCSFWGSRVCDEQIPDRREADAEGRFDEAAVGDVLEKLFLPFNF